MEVWGIHDAFNGLLESPFGVRPLTPSTCAGLLQRGGTVLGTTNRGDPFAWGPERRDRSGELAAAVTTLGLDGLVVLGGDGTQRIADRLMRERGVPVIGVPKTIDNDLDATDWTFGFQSAVDAATDALDRLHTTAESHDRVMLLEVMGRDAGHIALHAGIAGGADVILLPEIPWRPRAVADKILARRAVGRNFSIVVVAEGALPERTDADGEATPADRRRAGGGAGAIAMAALGPLLDADLPPGAFPTELRCTVLGHLQRGGGPVPFDRVLATRMGVGAVDLLVQGRWGELVRVRHDAVSGVPIREAIARNRQVDVSGELVATARAVGVCLGDR
jgi:6-phosphofructokinase 1